MLDTIKLILHNIDYYSKHNPLEWNDWLETHFIYKKRLPIPNNFENYDDTYDEFQIVKNDFFVSILFEARRNENNNSRFYLNFCNVIWQSSTFYFDDGKTCVYETPLKCWRVSHSSDIAEKEFDFIIHLLNIQLNSWNGKLLISAR